LRLANTPDCRIGSWPIVRSHEKGKEGKDSGGKGEKKGIKPEQAEARKRPCMKVYRGGERGRQSQRIQ